MLWWFDQTHELAIVGLGSAQSQCVRYPREGGLAGQDAWLWQALTVVRQTSNAILAEQADLRDRRRPQTP